MNKNNKLFYKKNKTEFDMCFTKVEWHWRDVMLEFRHSLDKLSLGKFRHITKSLLWLNQECNGLPWTMQGPLFSFTLNYLENSVLWRNLGQATMIWKQRMAGDSQKSSSVSLNKIARNSARYCPNKRVS